MIYENKHKYAEEESIKDRVTDYWNLRSHTFEKSRVLERNSPEGRAFIRYIEEALPAKSGLRILDAGCGTGMFSLMLAQRGHRATGIDLTEHMILHARLLAFREDSQAEFFCMDAEKPDFPDHTFDAVVTRNLTWTLPHPSRAYAQWLRILKPGGVLINFDADYGHAPVNAGRDALPVAHAHVMLGEDMLEENERIKKQLSISSKSRPDWDIQELQRLGYEKISADRTISEHIYTQVNELYNPTPLFMLRAHKPGAYSI